MGQVLQPQDLVDRIIRLERELAEVRKKAGFSSSIISGGTEGLNKPWIPLSVHNTRFLNWPTTTAAAFEAIFEARAPRQQPKVTISILSAASDGSTNGEMRVMMGGYQEFLRIITPGAVFTDTVTVLNDDVALLAETPLVVEAKRTSGAGTIGVEIRYCYGWGDV
jgi:hypothetical protein